MICARALALTALAAGTLTAATLLVSCGKGAGGNSASKPAAASAAPVNAAAPTKNPDNMSQAAADLQSLFQTLGQQPASVEEPTSIQSSRSRPANRAADGPSTGSVALASSPHQFEAPAPAPPPAPAQTVVIDKPLNRAELAFRLADRIRSEPGWSPARQTAALLGLEMIQPGVGAPHIVDLASSLSGDQPTTTTELRKLLSEVAQSDSMLSDSASLGARLAEAGRQLMPPQREAGLELGTVALCTRVESFGRFTPYAGTRFVAGKSVPVIVYTEIRNFAQREDVSTSARWTVQLSQELELYLDADGSRQWRQPEQTVKDSSRSKRSDYYLVQRIDLPANLSVGRYNLKVIVRDKFTGAETERAVPIEIVADGRLVNAPDR